ncbi:MAG: integrase [Alphaproteobacteria bacterium]|nr:integrase [Alphaproteobacteria bacterium]
MHLSQKSSVDQREEKVRQYAKQSLSENSRRALAGDLQQFADWGGSIPTTPKMIARYISDHAEIHSIATIKRRLASISKAHNMAGHNNPVPCELVKMVLRGVQRQHGKPQRQATPILKEDLTVMLSYAPDNLKGDRDRALLMLGFCAALRRSELVSVRVKDLEFNAQGLVLTIPRSKTDASGAGEKIGVPFGRGKTCPVGLVQLWLEKSGREMGALFVSVRKGGTLTEKQLSEVT